MKQFTIETPIQKERHFHIPFEEAILESWELLQSKKPFTIQLPQQSGKSSLLQNLNLHILNNSSSIPILLDFRTSTRNGFSTIEKFGVELKRLLKEQAKNFSDQLFYFIDNFKLETMDNLLDFITELTQFENKTYYLLIDDADKHCRHDSFSAFLGLVIYSMELAKSRINTSFENVVITGSKSINNFHPYDRALADSEYFKTWTSKVIQTNYITESKETIENFLKDYASAIEFEVEPNTLEKLIEESSGKLLPINKMLQFYDKKVRVFKQKKVITPEEMQHVAGYALVPAPF